MTGCRFGVARGWLLVLLLVLLTAPAWAGYGEQKSAIAKAGRDMRTAQRFAAAGRFDEAAAAYGAAAAELASAAGGLDEKLQRTYERAAANLTSLHAELKAQGVAVAELGSLAPTMAAGDGGLAGGPPGEQVSFTSEIAPVLVQYCGQCHVDGQRGQFSMASYNRLMAGARGNQVIELGSGAESLLVQVIAGGSMPPAGDQPSPAQTARLVKWINQGAKFDGDDPDKSLREIKLGSGAPTAPAPPVAPAARPAMPSVAAPKGTETVSFALDVAPILVASCLDCHNGGQSRAGFDASTFAALLKGGDSGAAIAAGAPDRSLLVQKIRGTATEGARMPLNRPPLSDDQIATIVTWIAEGATFDAADPTMLVSRVSAIAVAAKATPDELATMRREAAMNNWRLALPDTKAERVANERLEIVGNLTPSQLEGVLQTAESELAAVRRYFDLEQDGWLKGPLTVYAFPSRIDYAEFRTMVERRETDRGDLGHARFDVVEPYIALVATDDDVEVRLATLLGTIAAAQQGNGGLPDWFATGSGRAAAAKLHSGSKLAKSWKEQLGPVVASVPSANDFLDGLVAPQTRELMAQAMIEDIRSQKGKYDKIVDTVAAGKSFDEATRGAYNLDSKALVAAWLKSRKR